MYMLAIDRKEERKEINKARRRNRKRKKKEEEKNKTHNLNPEIPQANPIRYFGRYELRFAIHVEADQVFGPECAR